MAQAPVGTLYGTTYYGGSHRGGNAYSLTPGGTFTNLVSCTLENCLYPIRVVIGADGSPEPLNSADHELVVVDA